MGFDQVDAGRRLAEQAGEDTEDWTPDDFAEYFIQCARDEGETIREASWECGSFAGITRFQGVFIGYDDAEIYGPFATYEEALRHGPVFTDMYDDFISDYTHPDYEEPDED